MIRGLRARIGDESGISLPEMLIASLISAVVSTLLITTLFVASKTDQFTDQDQQAITGLQTSLNRFEKELRQARKVYTDSTTSVIKFWVDRDRDNQQDPVERISWSVVPSGSKANFTRSTDAGGTSYVASGDFKTTSVFDYDPEPPRTTLVTVTFVADVSPGKQASARTVRTKVLLRNADA